MTVQTNMSVCPRPRPPPPPIPRRPFACARRATLRPRRRARHAVRARRRRRPRAASQARAPRARRGLRVGHGVRHDRRGRVARAAQRASMLEALDDAGVDLATQVLAGVAASSVEDAAAQANQLYDAGGRGILLAPPFYFKGVGDEGVFRWLASVIERCRSPREVVVYHIPSGDGRAVGVVARRPAQARVSRRRDRGEGLQRRLGVDRAAARRPPGPAHPRRRRAPARPRGPARRLRRDQRVRELLRARAPADGRARRRGAGHRRARRSAARATR